MSQPLPPTPQADESVYFRIHRNVPLIPVSRKRLEHASPVLKQEFRHCVRQGPNLGQNYDDMPMAIQIFLVWLYTGRLPVIADFEIFTSIDLNARAFRTYQLALVTAWKFGHEKQIPRFQNLVMREFCLAIDKLPLTEVTLNLFLKIVGGYSTMRVALLEEMLWLNERESDDQDKMALLLRLTRIEGFQQDFGVACRNFRARGQLRGWAGMYLVEE